MTWVAVPINPDDVTAEVLFKLAEKHRLIPENIGDAVDYYTRICGDCALISVREEDTGDEVASLIISDIKDGDSAQVDFIPKPQYFTARDPFKEMINEAISPVFDKLIEGRNLRRLTSMVPKTRSRTSRSLIACGFKKEGVMRDAIKFKGKDPEGLVILGRLPEKEN